MGEASLSHLSLNLFGTFSVSLDGKLVGSFGSVKAQGLLAYLALRSARPHLRTSLAALLWPEGDKRSTSQNLRQTLYLLNKGIRNSDQGVPFLLTSGQTVQFNSASDCSVDVFAFREHLDKQNYESALGYYRGDLLAGLDCDSEEFDAWLTAERERCHQQALSSCRTMGHNALAAGDPEKAIEAARRLLELEPWHESAHRLLMRALVASGDRPGAILQFGRCKMLLRQEMNASPSPETEALYASIIANQMSDDLTYPTVPMESSEPERVTEGTIAVPADRERDVDTPLALDWIVAEERDVETEQGKLDMPAPPAPVPVPEYPGFVGREAELAYFAARLNESGLAVIRGMAGIGKTALAAKLCRRTDYNDEEILWHSFRAGEGAETLLWRLAAFLARHGRTTLWHMLQRARLTNGQPPPTDTLVDYVVQELRNGGYLLCFDDYQHVDTSASLNHLVERLLAHADGKAGPVKIIVTTRRLPPFALAVDSVSLAGLSIADASAMAVQTGVSIVASQLEALWSRTWGNAMFLSLTLEALAHNREQDHLLARINQAEDVERYLLREIFDRLSEQERAVMGALSILLGQSASRHLLEALTEENVYRALRHLVERHLLLVQVGEEERQYSQHDIVREFFYDQLSLRHRQMLHYKAAGAFANDLDWMNAAKHLNHAGQARQTADLLLAHVWSIVNLGQAEELISMLETLSTRIDESDVTLQILLNLGDLYVFVGDTDRAISSYRRALDALTDQPKSAVGQICQARAYHGIGKAQQRANPRVAIEWMERGLEAVRDLDDSTRSQILIDSGSTGLLIGDYGTATELLEAGLAITSEKQHHLRLFGLSELASVYLWTGRGKESESILNDALSLADRLGDEIAKQTLLLNQGILFSQLGDLPVARRCMERALESAQKLGATHTAIITLISLGVVYARVRDYQEYERFLLRAGEIADARGHVVGQVMVLNNQGMSSLSQGRYEEALEYAQQAFDKASALDLVKSKAYVLDTMALAYLGLSRFDDALDAIQEALKIGADLNDTQVEAAATYTHGRILVAAGKRRQGVECIRRSIILSESVDLLDCAKAKLSLGEILIDDGDIDEGVDLVKSAQQYFIQLGIEHLADVASRLLSEHN